MRLHEMHGRLYLPSVIFARHSYLTDHVNFRTDQIVFMFIHNIYGDAVQDLVLSSISSREQSLSILVK